MDTVARIGQDFRDALGMSLFPIGFGYRSKKPEGALSLKKKGAGCIMPLIYAAAQGKTVAFDEESTGWPCSAFYLGFARWIYPGIERYLSDGLAGRECERFVASPELAKSYLESVRLEPPSQGVAVFAPLEHTTDEDAPEVVIFFADADRLSALVFLAQFSEPERTDRVVTSFASACGAVTTLPLRHARAHESKAFWGMHDIAARARLPHELMTFAMPLDLARKMHADIGRSFLGTSRWRDVREAGGTGRPPHAP